MLRDTVAPSHRVTYFCKFAANRSAGSEYIVQVLWTRKVLGACRGLQSAFLFLATNFDQDWNA